MTEQDQEKTPPGAGLEDRDFDAWLSGLDVNDETRLIVLRHLVGELEEFVLFRRGLDVSGEIGGHGPYHVSLGDLGDLFEVSTVSAGGASGHLAALRIRFSAKGYRRVAQAAKDSVTATVHRDG